MVGLCAAAMVVPAAAIGGSGEQAAHAVTSRHAPTPLPVDSSGLPADRWQQVASLAPGQIALLAVKPAGSGDWYAPGDVGATSPAPGIVSVPSAPSSTSGSAASAMLQYGCTVNEVSPGYTTPTTIRGHINFYNCENLFETNTTVCMKDSKTYGEHACAPSGWLGNAPWTAYSYEYICQPLVSREWSTDGTVQFIAIDDQQALYGVSSGWGSALNC